MHKLNTSENLAVRGYDVVAYFDGQAKIGDPALAAEYDGARFYFSTPDNKARFESAPEQFLPAYGGYCAYAMSEGKQFDVDPRSYKVVDGRLYLFYDGVGGHTLDFWNANEAERQQNANKIWESGSYA